MTEKRDQRLSALGRKVETLLKVQIDAMEQNIRDAKKEGIDPKFSLTDLMKVTDRALKLEAIRSRIDGDGEGDFFKAGNSDGGADDGLE